MSTGDAMEDKSLQRRMENFLLKYDPAKIRTVSALLKSFDHNVTQLISAMTRKYGPEPTDENEIVALRAKLMPAGNGAKQTSARASSPQRGAAPAPSSASSSATTVRTSPKAPPRSSTPSKGSGANPLSGGIGAALGAPSAATAATPPSKGKESGTSRQQNNSPPIRTSTPPKAHGPPAGKDTGRSAGTTSLLPEAESLPADGEALPPLHPLRTTTPNRATVATPAAPASPPQPKAPKATVAKKKSTTAQSPPSPPSGGAAAHDPARIVREAQIAVLRRMYETHAPERVSDVESVLEKHEHEVPEMFQAMENKYGLARGSLQRQVDDQVAASNSAGGASGVEPVDGAASPASTRHHLSRSVEEASKHIVREVLQKFLIEEVPDAAGKERANGVPALLQQYNGRHQDLFVALQSEFHKPEGFFKKQLAAASKRAAGAIARDGKYEPSASSVSASGKVLTGGPAFWDRLERLAAAGPSASAAGMTTRVFTFREQLEFFCDKYCPMKARNIDAALRVYRGNELGLLHDLHTAYGVTSSDAYLPPVTATRVDDRRDGTTMATTGGTAADGASPAAAAPSAETSREAATPKVPETMRASAELARHYGLGPQYVPRTIDYCGRQDDTRVLYETLVALFPDAVYHALSSEEQKLSFAARRLANFFSFHQPSAKPAIGKLLEQYAKAGRLDDVLADVLLRFYGPVLAAVTIPAFRPGDIVGAPSATAAEDALVSSPSGALNRALDDSGDASLLLSSPSSIGFSPVMAADGDRDNSAAAAATAEAVLRRREFRRHVDDWFQTYGSNGALSRSTPRFLGRTAEMVSCSTTTNDLPRNTSDAVTLTLHREQEEARLLGLQERGVVTDPFNFEIRSYADQAAAERRALSGGAPPSLSEMRRQRHREMFGLPPSTTYGRDSSTAVDAGAPWSGSDGGKTRLTNPLIFLEDDDCSKCRVLQHHIHTLSDRLHALRAAQQHRERLLAYDEMERQAASEALMVSLAGRGGDPSLMEPCGGCAVLREQVRHLSATLHSVRSRKMPGTAEMPQDVSPRSPDRHTTSPRRRYVTFGSSGVCAAPTTGRIGLPSRMSDASTMTELDNKKFSDLRSYFLLSEL